MSNLAGQRRATRWLSARRGTWTGAKWADFESDAVLIEHKSGITNVPARLVRWWSKLLEEAAVVEKEPVLLLDLPNGRRIAVVRAETIFVGDGHE